MIPDPRFAAPARPRLLTRKQAAARVDKSEGTIRYWIKEGLRERLGGRILETELLAMERTMRERRGRPRLVNPRDVLVAEVVAEWERLDGEGRYPVILHASIERQKLIHAAAFALRALAAYDEQRGAAK